MKTVGVDFVASVPCANLQGLIPLIDSDPDIIHVPVSREEEGVGLCAGAYMGGKRPAMVMQNSGLGNSINALASLTMLYQLPLLMVLSHRGSPGERIVAQEPMGRLTPQLLDVMDIPYFSPEPGDAKDSIDRAWNVAEYEGTPAVVLLDIRFWRTVDEED